MYTYIEIVEQDLYYYIHNTDQLIGYTRVQASLRPQNLYFVFPSSPEDKHLQACPCVKPPGNQFQGPCMPFPIFVWPVTTHFSHFVLLLSLHLQIDVFLPAWALTRITFPLPRHYY